MANRAVWAHAGGKVRARHNESAFARYLLSLHVHMLPRRLSHVISQAKLSAPSFESLVLARASHQSIWERADILTTLLFDGLTVGQR